MKTLDLEQIQALEGGSCSGAVALAVGTGIALAFWTGPVGWGVAAAVFLAYGNAENVTNECIR